MIRLAPTDVFIDTSLTVAKMFPGLPDSTAGNQFCADLTARRTRVYFAPLLRIELLQAMRNLVTRNQLPPETRQRFQLDLWDANVLVRHRWLVEGMRQFDIILDQFDEWFEIEGDSRIWRRSIELMALHQLRSNDAVLAATALENGVFDFATCDDHFARVDHLNLWLIRDPAPPAV